MRCRKETFTDGGSRPDAEIVASMGKARFDTASEHSELFGEENAGKFVKQWQFMVPRM